MLVISGIELHLKDIVRKTNEILRMSTRWNQKAMHMAGLPPRKGNVGREA